MKTGTITINSSDETPEFIDITEKVQNEVASSGAKEGSVLVYSKHTTASIVIQEPEENLKKDLKNLLHKLAPKDSEYHHRLSPDHIEDQMPNGHSHSQHLFMGTSEIIPFTNSKLMLGTFQKVFLVELDRARTREIVIQVTGE